MQYGLVFSGFLFALGLIALRAFPEIENSKSKAEHLLFSMSHFHFSCSSARYSIVPAAGFKPLHSEKNMRADSKNAQRRASIRRASVKVFEGLKSSS